MLNKNLLKLVRYATFAFSIGISSNTMASYLPDYTCPESHIVKAAINSAIQENKNEVRIPTRFGELQVDLETIDVDNLNNLTFSYATFLFGDVNFATYEVACAYKTPNVVFYKYSNDGNYTIYTGTSPNWIPDANQLYATCTYSARYCVFMKKHIQEI